LVVGPNAAGMVVAHPERGVLTIWRHRSMPETWAWEIPGGVVDEAEPADLATRRECLEETGWEPLGEIRHLSRHHPSVGLVRQTFDIFLATDARHVGPPEDANEAARVEWRSYDDVAADLFNGAISDGFTQLAVTLALGVTGRGALLER
jgi:8-oxo-dGTP pyrophosphatase MutT (NUDIX family)